MEKLPVELWLLVVDCMSSLEDRATLRRVSRVWQASVDGSSIESWLQRLPVEVQFATTLDAGLQIKHHAHGRGSFVHTFISSLYLAPYPCVDFS
jgi:hypothetical protein